MNTLFFNSQGKCVLVINMEQSLINDLGLIGKHSAEYSNPEDCYLEDDIIKPINSFSEIISPNTVSNLPPGTTVILAPDSVLVDDGTLELEVDYPTTITAKLTHPHYKDKVIEVSCEV